MRKHKHIKALILLSVFITSVIGSVGWLPSSVKAAETQLRVPDGPDRQYMVLSRLGDGGAGGSNGLQSTEHTYMLQYKADGSGGVPLVSGGNGLKFQFDIKDGRLRTGSPDYVYDPCKSESALTQKKCRITYSMKYQTKKDDGAAFNIFNREDISVNGSQGDSFRADKLRNDGQWQTITAVVDRTKIPVIFDDDGDTYYRLALNVLFDEPNNGIGAVNAFQLRKTPGSGKVSVGYAQSRGNPEGKRAFAIENRLSADDFQDTYTFKFRAPCNYKKSDGVRLEWFDADFPGNEPDGLLGWRLYEKRSGVWKQIESMKNEELGGQGAYKKSKADFEAGKQYKWEWYSADRNNAIQLWMPWATTTAGIDCSTTEGTCKIVAPDQVDPGEVIDVTLRATNRGSKEWRRPDDYFEGTNQLGSGGGWSLESSGQNEIRTNPNRVLFTADQTPVETDETVSLKFRVKAADNLPANQKIGFKFMSAQGSPFSCVKSFKGPIPNNAKVFGANLIEAIPEFVRDNFNFSFLIKTYLWPNGGHRQLSDEEKQMRFWHVGRWGEDQGDTSNSETSKQTDLNTLDTFNSNAEVGCMPLPASASCKQRIPLAYVNNSSGGRTPNGSKWYDIREENFNTSGWNQYDGGIASGQNRNQGGFTGNKLLATEIFNLRLAASSIVRPQAQLPFQGAVSAETLQDQLEEEENSWTADGGLPVGSQGPKTYDGESATGLNNTFDNIRPNPNITAASRAEFPAIDLRPFGGEDPNDMLEVFAERAQTVGTANATSLLQDGKGNGYHARQEPLSLTSGFERANLSLQWDEYLKWSQVDNKGYYSTIQGSRVTGIATGERTNEANTSVNKYILDSYGSRQAIVTYTYTAWWYASRTCTLRNNKGTCIQWVNNPNSFTVQSGTGQCPPPRGYSYGCTQRSSTSYTSPQTYCPNDSDIRYITTPRTYYDYTIPNNRFGWVKRTLSSFPSKGSIPSGGNNSTAQSYFAQPNYDGWRDTGSEAYWQDPSVTTMSNEGSTLQELYLNQWVKNTSDPMYAGRRVFDDATTVNIRTGWERYKGGSGCVTRYPNGSHHQASVRANLDPVYNPRNLFENSTPGDAAGDSVYGLYGAGATFDGKTDGQVDVDWEWNHNWQRVKYEHSAEGSSRDIGRFPQGNNVIIDLFNNQGLKPARGVGAIGNPTIEASDADIYAGGGLSSYFETSGSATGSAAFVFTPTSIGPFNFDSPRSFTNYFNNPDRTRSNTLFSDPFDPNKKPHDNVFSNFSSMNCSPPNTNCSTQPAPSALSSGGTVNLDGKTYRSSSNLTINANVEFCRGAGTIIVNGNLTINGNLSYCGAAITSRSQLPSVGFIVTGDIRVNPNVTNLVGAFFTDQEFTTGSSVTGTTGNDVPLRVQGLVIANNFLLQRQTSGQQNVDGRAETFAYDGRIVINPPPHFSEAYGAPAVWNEAAPRN